MWSGFIEGYHKVSIEKISCRRQAGCIESTNKFARKGAYLEGVWERLRSESELRRRSRMRFEYETELSKARIGTTARSRYSRLR